MHPYAVSTLSHVRKVICQDGQPIENRENAMLATFDQHLLEIKADAEFGSVTFSNQPDL